MLSFGEDAFLACWMVSLGKRRNESKEKFLSFSRSCSSRQLGSTNCPIYECSVSLSGNVNRKRGRGVYDGGCGMEAQG